jgi:hypothetical protein
MLLLARPRLNHSSKGKSERLTYSYLN